MSTAQLSPGTVVDDKFTIGAPLWARAGAQTYAATDEHGRAVWLTGYGAECFSSGLVLERSLREQRQLQSLQCPQVAAVLGCGKLPDGGIYEINAPLVGDRLDDVVAAGPMSGPEAAAIIEQIGLGLVEAQKAGVTHRNLGPRVVFVGPEGVVVGGFCVGEPHGDKSNGPLDTIAPEQIEGKVVDQRTLIYNLAALMHMLLTGAPMFGPDEATQLAAHLGDDPPDDTHARLRRALGKDPRMRPMMLKQFLSELRAIGGSAARAPLAPSTRGPNAPPLPGSDLATPAAAKPASVPSSRGWTMFGAAVGDAPAAGTAAGAVAAAAVSAPVLADAEGAKPKTRGWTMFMEGADSGAAAAKEELEKNKPKPSTRGWTMFMEEESAAASDGAAAEAPVAAAPKPAPAPEAGPPKTRGWTMFMEDDQEPAAAAATPAAAPIPTPAPMPAAAPVVGGTAPKPSTRGWTMFMKADEESVADAVAVAAPVAAAPIAAPVVPVPIAAPVVPIAAPVVPVPIAAPVVPVPIAAPVVPVSIAAAPIAAPVPLGQIAQVEPAAFDVQDDGADPLQGEDLADAPAEAAALRRSETDAPAKKRGWTMFMDKPITDASDEALGGVVPSTGESDAKGWTVFSPAAEVATATTQEGPAGEPERPMQPPAPAVSATLPGGGPAAASGQTIQTISSAEAAATEGPLATDPSRRRVKTLVVTNVPEPSPPTRIKTVVAPPGSGPIAGMPPAVVRVITPDTTPSGPISGPISGYPAQGFPAPIGTDAMLPAKKSSPVALIVIGVVIVVAVIVVAIVMSST